MLKKEIIWREILYQVLEKKNNIFTQKELAQKFAFSLSTVFNSLKAPRQIKAIKVTGRNFQVINPQKFLYLWGTFRRLEKEIIYQTNFKASVTEAESLLPPKAIFAAYSAYRKHFKAVPADYDKVYLYSPHYKLADIKKRFPVKKGYSNFIVLKTDAFLADYGPITTLAQTFVDIWNLEDWYAQDYIKAMEEKLKMD